MPSKRKKPGYAANTGDQDGREGPPLHRAEVLSFLQETQGKGKLECRGLGEVPQRKRRRGKAGDLQAQGYIEASEDGEWLTTVSGDTVSGSRPPRFTPESVEAALSTLAERIKATNQDANARFRITRAVAFGDFLAGGARVQAPDVGVQLSPREPAREHAGSAVEKMAEREFLRQLKGKSSVLGIRPYED
jgi:hypothetical protein